MTPTTPAQPRILPRSLPSETLPVPCGVIPRDVQQSPTGFVAAVGSHRHEVDNVDAGKIDWRMQLRIYICLNMRRA